MSTPAHGLTLPKDSRNVFLFGLFGLLPLLLTLYNGYRVETTYTGETVGVIMRTERDHQTTAVLPDWPRYLAVMLPARSTSGPDCAAYVGYMVDGKAYTTQHDSCGTGVKVGKKVKVYYDPADPSSTSFGFRWFLALLGLGWWGGFSVLSFFIALKYSHGGWREAAGRFFFRKVLPSEAPTV